MSIGLRSLIKHIAALYKESPIFAGRPATIATGRSSTWWLRNQALPSTQAFLALVILWPSTVSSMSSQTQPQKVQVALLTIFSSVADIGPGSLTFRGECSGLLHLDVDPLAGRHARA